MVRLYLITPDGLDPAPAVRAALAALPPGSAAVQLRQSVHPRELLARARALLAACRAHGAPLLINDRLDVALAAGADGVHLPVRGLPVPEARALLGPGRLAAASAHSRDELARAAGADFCVFGPVFDTPGKGPAQGLDALAAAARGPVPLFALGGVDEHNARRCIQAGAQGIACIRAVLGAADPGAAARALWKAVEG